MPDEPDGSANVALVETDGLGLIIAYIGKSDPKIDLPVPL